MTTFTCSKRQRGFTFSIPSRSHLNRPQLLKWTDNSSYDEHVIWTFPWPVWTQKIDHMNEKDDTWSLTCSVCWVVYLERWLSVHRDIWRNAWRHRATAGCDSAPHNDLPAWSTCNYTGSKGTWKITSRSKQHSLKDQSYTFLETPFYTRVCRRAKT